MSVDSLHREVIETSGMRFLLPSNLEKESDETYRRTMDLLFRMRTKTVEALRGQWVAISGKELVGIQRTKTKAYRECLSKGLPDGSFVVRLIQPIPPEDEETAFGWM